MKKAPVYIENNELTSEKRKGVFITLPTFLKWGIVSVERVVRALFIFPIEFIRSALRFLEFAYKPR